jgi:hypothetical protein
MTQKAIAKPTPYICVTFGRLHLIHNQNWTKEEGLTATPNVKARILHTYLLAGHSKKR